MKDRLLAFVLAIGLSHPASAQISSEIEQIGDGHTVELSQTFGTGGGTMAAEIHQAGADNTAKIDQKLSGFTVDVIVKQDGTGNQLDHRQASDSATMTSRVEQIGAGNKA